MSELLPNGMISNCIQSQEEKRYQALISRKIELEEKLNSLELTEQTI